MKWKRPFLRGLLALLLLAAAAGVLAPFVNAEAFRLRIEAALERSLQRKVRVGAAHFNLFTGPGFTVSDVLIGDDPSAGAEPFAHVESLEARVQPRTLWTGRLSFSTLRLIEPTVNLVKTAAGPWNVQTFPGGGPGAGAASSARAPDIQVRSGRINFKFGDTKSVFYISDADLDIYPNGKGAVVVRFSGAPSRTDRGAQGFGRVSARGLFDPRSGGRLHMGVQLERSALSELVTLFHGHDLGIQGFASASGEMDGPPSRLKIGGNLLLEGLHRWDLMPSPRDNWALGFLGFIDTLAQEVSIETTAPGDGPPPMAARVHVIHYLADPAWEASLEFHDLPAASLVDASHRMGLPFPAGLAVTGTANGRVVYRHPDGVEGSADVDGVSIASPGFRPLSVAHAAVTLKANRVELAPVTVEGEGKQSAEISAAYDFGRGRFSARIESRGVELAGPHSGLARQLAGAGLPIPPALRQGIWRGTAEFAQEDGQPGEWTSQYELLDAQMELPEFSMPVFIPSAFVDVNRGTARIRRLRARLGRGTVEGEASFSLAGDKPILLRLKFAALDLAEAERVCQPALRRKAGLFSRLRLGAAPPPAWMKDRSVEGPVSIEALSAGGEPLGSLRARLVWRGPVVELTDIEWSMDGAAGAGKAAIDLSGAEPQYRIEGHVDDLAWRHGTLGFAGNLIASGVGRSLAAHASATGAFDARGVQLAPETAFDGISGSFRFASGSGFVLEQLQAVQGEDAYTGQGGSQPDGRILIELKSGLRQIRELTAGLRLTPDGAR